MKILELLKNTVEQYSHNAEDYDFLTEYERCQVDGDVATTYGPDVIHVNFGKMSRAFEIEPNCYQGVFDSAVLRRIAFSLLALSDTLDA